MRFSKKAKIIYTIIWTGIFVAASCLIVKGEQMLDINLSSYLKKSISMAVIKGSNPLFAMLETGDEKKEDASLKEEVLEGGSDNTDFAILNGNTDLPVVAGEGYFEETDVDEKAAQASAANVKKIKELKSNLDTDYLIKNFYIVDNTTSVDKKLFPVKKMLSKDFSIKKKEKPQILIFHTHGGTESFSDSRAGVKADSIIGVGSYLAKLLTDYGYEVIHDKSQYDIINGKADRNKAYNKSLEGVTAQLKKYPHIEVVIDLHRDGVAGSEKKLTTVNGKKTARFMLFNGLSRNKQGPIDYLANPNLEDNLAFSLQLKLKAMETYPGLTTPNYLKGYRYNLHLAKRSLLIELGNQNNTLEEAKNAMEPLADILNQILEGK